MSSLQPTTQGLAADPGALNALKYGAAREGDGGKGALKEAAKQFESLFMRELIKSMRDATQKSGLLEGQGSDLGTDLLDQQLAVQLSGLPGGLSESIERQLSRQMNAAQAKAGTAADGSGNAAADASSANTASTASAGSAPEFKPLKRSDLRNLLKYAPAAPATGAQASAATDQTSAAARRALSPSQRHAAFVQQHHQAAATVARESGIPAGYMIGQAGHETGWGKSEIRMRDGTPSHNLFGIKATSNWKGKVAEVTTTEYIGGVARKVTAKFRAYDSYEEAFKDHARLLSQSPRYSQAMAQTDSVRGYAQGLQRGGYATDPAYADKLTQVINTALRLQQRSA
jgi:flagellar protein FlgJ